MRNLKNETKISGRHGTVEKVLELGGKANSLSLWSCERDHSGDVLSIVVAVLHVGYSRQERERCWDYP